MVISSEWTNPDDLEKAPADYLTSTNWNAVLGSLLFHHATPQVAVRLTASQAVADSTTDVVSWGEAVWETPDTMWDASAPTLVVVPRSGIYTICASALWAAGTDGTKRALFIHINSSATPRIGLQLPSTDPTEFTLSFDTNLALGDTIDMRVRQLSGGSLSLLDTRTRMTVRWVGDPP